MSFLGADTDELRGAADECLQGKEVTDQVIQYLQALIALLKAASFFSGGASAAYAEYLETVVVPWLQKISQALELFAKVLGANAEAQDQASQGETVDAGSLPTYTSQVSGSSAVQPFTGSVLGSGSTAGAAFGAISSAATGSGLGDPSATPTTVTVTSPDGTVTSIGPGAGATTGTAAPVTTHAGGHHDDPVVDRRLDHPARQHRPERLPPRRRPARLAQRGPRRAAAGVAASLPPVPLAAEGVSGPAPSTAAPVPPATPASAPTPVPRPCTAARAPAVAPPAPRR